MQYFKMFLLGVAFVLIIHIIKLVIIGIYNSITHMRANKLFHYFDSTLVLADNANENDLYIVLGFRKYINTKSDVGYGIDYLDTVFIGNYKVLDKDLGTTSLDKLFIVPMIKYEKIVDKVGEDNISLNDLIKESCFFIQYDEDVRDISLHIGNYNIFENSKYLKSAIQTKGIITKYYRIAAMKKDNLGLVMVLPEVMEQFNESLENMSDKIRELFNGENKEK